jgi:hypothetical protein
MDEMSADEQLGLAIPQFSNCVRLPYFLKECLSHFCRVLYRSLQQKLARRTQLFGRSILAPRRNPANQSIVRRGCLPSPVSCLRSPVYGSASASVSQNSEFRIQNSGLRTQNKEDGEWITERVYASSPLRRPAYVCFQFSVFGFQSSCRHLACRHLASRRLVAPGSWLQNSVCRLPSTVYRLLSSEF